MTTWEHDGQKFQYVSTYCLPADAWHHELTGLDSAAAACVVIPDATPDGSFTPSPLETVTLRMAEGTFPWPIWMAFMGVVRDSHDLTDQ